MAEPATDSLFQRALTAGSYPAVMLIEAGLHQFGAQRLQPFERADFVGAHEPRITDDVRGQYGGKPAFHGVPLPDR